MSTFSYAKRSLSRYTTKVSSTFSDKGGLAAAKYAMVGEASMGRKAALIGAAGVGAAINYQDSRGSIAASLQGAAVGGALGLGAHNFGRVAANLGGARNALSKAKLNRTQASANRMNTLFGMQSEANVMNQSYDRIQAAKSKTGASMKKIQEKMADNGSRMRATDLGRPEVINMSGDNSIASRQINKMADQNRRDKARMLADARRLSRESNPRMRTRGGIEVGEIF